MFKIKNWASFQSYKDRSPPWIRLHKRILDDFTYHQMGAEARALLPMLWLMASEDTDPVSGMLRFDYKVIAFRLRQPELAIKKAMAEIIASGFVDEINHDKTYSYKSVTEKLQNCHSETETETETETEADTEGEYTSDFEVFWSAYPKRSGSNPKKPAFQKYEKARKSGVSAEVMLSGSKAYAAHCKLSGDFGTKYVAQAATWLNQERWNDEYTATKKESQIDKLRRQTIGYVPPDRA